MRPKSKLRFPNRSRFDIIACILENSNARSRKTRLIYRCNLSLSQFNHYKDILVQNGLLKVLRQDEVKIYETTEKGKEFLNDYYNLKSILE